MVEYVDKEELLRCLEKKIKASNEYRMAVVDTDFIDLVNDATVIEDVVEVVRCKDCEHRNPNGYKCLRDNLWHDNDDFCSYGERKAGNEKGAVNGSEEVPGENQEN